MSYIDIQKIEVVRELLQEQIRGLREIYEQIVENERTVRHLSYTDSVRTQLRKARREVQDEIRVLKAFERCLGQTAVKYRKAEQRIQDIYQREVRIYPKPSFGVARICGMDGVRDLINIRGLSAVWPGGGASDGKDKI